MEPICFLLLAAFALCGVQTELVNIFDRSYDKTVLKNFRSKSPSAIKFVPSNITLYIGDKGYNVGPLDKLHSMIPTGEPYYAHRYNVKLADRYRNTIECERNRLVLFHNPETFVVYTGNDSHAIRCQVDYDAGYDFIIASTRENAKVGKLYVLNSGEYVITNFWVATEEIKELGDKVTAVGLGPAEDILITAETDSSRRSFDLILLKMLSKDVTTLDAFKDVVKNSTEKLHTLFDAEAKKRLDKLVHEIFQIHAEIKEKNLPDPPTNVDMNITCEILHVHYLINQTGNELIKMFNVNILGNEANTQKVREIQCLNNVKKLKDEISDYKKKVKNNFNSIFPTSLGSSVDITEETCLQILADRKDSFSCELTKKMDYNQLKYNEYDKIVQNAIELLTTDPSTSTDLKNSSVVTILGKNHLLSEVKVYFNDAPSYIEYRTFLSSLFLYINGRGYDIGRHFSTIKPATWFKPRKQDIFTDKHGNTLDCTHPKGEFTAGLQTVLVFSDPNIFVVQCHGDYEKSRAFIIGSSTKGATMGKLYVFDTTKIIRKTHVNVQEIIEAGENITAVTVRPLSGEVFLTEKMNILNKNGFRLILLRPISKHEEKVIKLLPKDAAEFTQVAKELVERLIDAYDKSWKECCTKLINQYYLYKATVNPIKEDIRNDSALHDMYNDHLREAVTANMERLFEIYHYNIAKLDDKISTERRERRICQSLFNTFQTKIVREIDNVFSSYNSETDGSLTDRFPEELSEKTCKETMIGNHRSYSCARTDEIRDERIYLRLNEKFLKKLRSAILSFDQS